jgi:hypothetical protein
VPFLLTIDLLDRVFEWKMPKRMYIVFLAAGLFLAMFAAWRDEHAKVNQLETSIRELTKPDFAVASPESAFGYDEQADQTLLWIVVGLANRGAASVAGGWKLEFESPRINTTVGFVQLPPETRGRFEGHFADEDSIYEKAMQKPIEKGAAVSGWAYFKIPGKAAFEALDDGTAVLHLIFYDYNNVEHKSESIHIGTRSEEPAYFPGVKGGFHKVGKSKQP